MAELMASLIVIAIAFVIMIAVGIATAAIGIFIVTRFSGSINMSNSGKRFLAGYAISKLSN